MLRHHICVSLYNIQIVFTNHDSTSSKFQQIPINRSCFIHISGLSTKAKYKRMCFQGSTHYYTLQPTRVLKASANSRSKRNEKKRGLKEDQDLQQYLKLSFSKHSLAIDFFVNLWLQVSTSSQKSNCQEIQVELSSIT
ncbi:hypothetical protein ACJW30_11G042600 [Castanea mollissima]